MIARRYYPGSAWLIGPLASLRSDLVQKLCFFAAVLVSYIIIICHVHAPSSVETLVELPLQFGARQSPLTIAGNANLPLSPGASCSVPGNYDNTDTALF